jgi:hypothetical protein
MCFVEASNKTHAQIYTTGAPALLQNNIYIITAWQCISPEMIVQGVKKCHTSNTMDETDDMLWNSSEDDGNVRSECEKDEGTDCEGGDSNTDL